MPCNDAMVFGGGVVVPGHFNVAHGWLMIAYPGFFLNVITHLQLKFCEITIGVRALMDNYIRVYETVNSLCFAQLMAE